MYDIIVIGCGPAGMTAAIYAKRAGKKVLILEKEGIGGQMASAPLIENYPGFSSIIGSELAERMFEQITDLEIEVEIEEVKDIKEDKIKKVITDENVYETKSIIIATGGKYRMLGLEKEVELIGSGIHFCTACDGPFYKDKKVAVIGGGNSAVAGACMLSNIAKKVYIIHRSKKLSADYIEIEKLKRKKNIEILLETNVKELLGDKELKGIILENGETLTIDGMFVCIGLVPQNKFCENILERNKQGFIISMDTKTNIPGIFVAGDCREKKGKQITIAVSDGTQATIEALTFLEETK